MTHAPVRLAPPPATSAHLRLVRGAASPARPYAALVEEAQRAEEQGRREEARSLYEEALQRVGEAAHAREASSLLRWIARTHQVDGQPELALECLEAALVIAEAHGDVPATGHARNLQAIVRWQQGEIDEAETLFVAAREAAVTAGEARLAAMTAQNLGVISNARGDFETALRRYEMSLADYRALGLPKYICLILNNLGMLHADRGRWQDAQAAYDEALHIAQVLGDQSVCIVIEANRAECAYRQGDLEAATHACARAVALSDRHDDQRARGELLKVQGMIAREREDYPRAEECLGRSLDIATERDDLRLVAEINREQADLFRRMGRNRDALQALNQAHKLFAKLQARHDLAETDRRVAGMEGEFLEIVRRWGESIESKDYYTQGHCVRVADIACALAARTGMDEKPLFWFRIGALLHDVGKLVIPSEVLNKTGRLTDAEWQLMRQHTTAGAQMLEDIDFPWDVRPIVESHHERWDGAGYPQGLAGEAIPLSARILCIADVYDALTSERAYKRALSCTEAMDIMRCDVGKQFDPTLFALFEEVVTEMAPAPRLAAAMPSKEPAPRPTPARQDHVATDELTALPLRRAFLERLAQALADHARTSEPVALLVIDVDHFKLVNDTYGHLLGDEVLRGVATTLREHVRAPDFLGRYAGDEFVVLLPRTGPEAAERFAERLRVAMQERRIPVVGRGTTVAPTLSIGVAASPVHGTSAEALFAAADTALYEAKRLGRNTVVGAGTHMEAQPTPTLQLDRLVGRKDELRRLTRAFEESLEGEARLVAVLGEAGIGKTSLLKALAPEVRMRAGALVIGRCVETEIKAPYGPWASVLNAIRVLRVVPEDRPWRELPHLVPAFDTGERAPDQSGNRFALFDEVVEYLRLAASARPLVLVLDDMQWADGASWDLLEHVMAHLDRHRVVVCLTIRAEDAAVDAEQRRARLSRDPRYRELTLGRLTSAEARDWLQTVFGHAPDTELLGFVHLHAEGNPFFTVQLLRMLVEEESLWWTGDQWSWRPTRERRVPTAIRDLLARRLERLTPTARQVLTAAAVIGRSFDVDLAVASEVGTEDDLLDAIDEGLAASVLEVSGLRGDDRYAFTHGLLVEALREAVNPRRLRRVHERVARAMETRDPTAAADIAAHYDAAGVSDRALHYALEAAARAATVYAHDEAAAFLQMAERHAHTPAALAEVRARHARVSEAAGHYAQAEELCAQALEWFTAQGDVARGAECRRMRERLRALQGQPSHVTRDACRALLVEARAQGLTAEAVALLMMISQTQSRLGDVDDAVALARESVSLAEQSDDRRLVADALTRLGSALLETDASHAITVYEEALVIYDDLDDLSGQVRCHNNLGIAHVRIGNTAAAEEAYGQALARGRATYVPELAGLSALNLGVLYMKRGRYEEARARVQEALELFSRLRSEAHRLAASYNLAHLAREEGSFDEARELYESTATRAAQAGIFDLELGALAGAGLAALRAGDAESASVFRRRAAERLMQRPMGWFQGRELLTALDVHVASASGQMLEARERLDRTLALTARHDAHSAAWLVAECAPLLRVTRSDVLAGLVRRYAREAETRGFAPLVARYAEMLRVLDGDARPADATV